MSLASKVQQYDTLVDELFSILDKTEETDDGKEFRPNQFTSCRVQDTAALEDVLLALKRTREDLG